jgi:hypothetical protein
MIRQYKHSGEYYCECSQCHEPAPVRGRSEDAVIQSLPAHGWGRIGKFQFCPSCIEQLEASRVSSVEGD